MLKFVSEFMKSRLKRFHDEEDAPTMVEYGLLVALIALVVILAAVFVGTEVSQTFGVVGASVDVTNP